MAMDSQASVINSNGRDKLMDEGRRAALAQQLLQRVVELEDENRVLRSDLVTISSSYKAAMAKNNLFQAKILELQARIDVGPNPSAIITGERESRYRSPLVAAQGAAGALTYRFERASRPERPQSARVHPSHPSAHASGALTERAYQASTAATSTATNSATRRPAAVSKLMLNFQTGPRRKGGFLPVAMASSNPRSVERIFGEFRRLQAPGHALGGGGGPPHQPPPPLSDRSSSGSNPMTHTHRAQPDEDSMRQLESDVLEGRVTKQTPLNLDIVYCVDTGHRSLAVRQKPDRYRQVAADIRDAAAVTFEGHWNVSVTVLELMHNPNSSDKLAQSLGCFEVSLNWTAGGTPRSAVLHSKDRMRSFPDIFDLISGLLHLLAGPEKNKKDSGGGERRGGEGGGEGGGRISRWTLREVVGGGRCHVLGGGRGGDGEGDTSIAGCTSGKGDGEKEKKGEEE